MASYWGEYLDSSSESNEPSEIDSDATEWDFEIDSSNDIDIVSEEILKDDELGSGISGNESSGTFDAEMASSSLIPQKKCTMSDEEEQWLSALEAGNLDDSGQIKGFSSNRILTQRQRRLLQAKESSSRGETEESLDNASTAHRLTDDQLQKRKQKAHRRKQLAEAKKEKVKKETLHKLLTKKEVRMKKISSRKQDSEDGAVHTIRYISNISNDFDEVELTSTNECVGCPQFLLCLPEEKKNFFQKQVVSGSRSSSLPLICAIPGCSSARKYTCSQTKAPVCSLSCYRRNLEIAG